MSLLFKSKVLHLNCSFSKENVNVNSGVGVNEVFNIGTLIAATLNLLQLQCIAFSTKKLGNIIL